MKIDEMTIYAKTVEVQKAIYSPYPEQLNPELAKFLKADGIPELYCHQAEMFRLAMEGRNVVLTTATASGKTLGFLLPVLL